MESIKIFGTETQETIAAWANATFGPVHQTRTTLSRANKEMAELLHAVWVSGSDADVAAEIADVIIVLCRYPVSIATVPAVGYTMYDEDAAIDAAALALIDAMLTWKRSHEEQRSCVRYAVSYLRRLATLLCIDIPTAIDAKMKINRARRWRVKGGHGQHIDPDVLDGDGDDVTAIARIRSKMDSVDGLFHNCAMQPRERGPMACPCDPSCYCKSHTCRPR